MLEFKTLLSVITTYYCDNLPAQCSFLENESSNHIQSTTIQTYSTYPFPTFLQAKGLKAALTITTATYHWTSVVWCRDHLVSLPGVPCLWCTTVGASKIHFWNFHRCFIGLPLSHKRSQCDHKPINLITSSDFSILRSIEKSTSSTVGQVSLYLTEQLLPWSSTSKYLI